VELRPAGAAFRGYDRLVRGCVWVAGVFVTVLMGLLVLDVLAGVLFRYVLELPLEWNEELARFLIIAVTFIGAVVPLERGRHFQVDIVTTHLSGRWCRLVLSAANMVIGVSLLVLIVHGWAMTEVTAAEESPALGLPYGWTYATIPLGAALMLLVVARDLWALWMPQQNSDST
jgi:TRAP-type C4-dicarboxylate transport system permease small subunit